MLIAPGNNMVCTRSSVCDCGCSVVTEKAIYMCTEIALWPWHRFGCDIEGCEGIVVGVEGQDHCFCSQAFKPLNDGDTSLVDATKESTYDDILKDGPKTPAPRVPTKEIV